MSSDQTHHRSAEAIYEEGLKSLAAGDADRARRLFSEVLKRDSQHAKAYCGRGIANRTLGNLNESLRDCSAALHIDSMYARALFNRGLGRFEKGKTDSALKDIARAIEWDPEAAFYYYRAQCLLKLDRFEEAVDDLTSCIGMDPDRAFLFYRRAWVLSRTGKPDEAILDLKEAIQRGFRKPEAYDALAYELNEQKKYTQAVVVLDEGIKACGRDSQLLFRRGCALFSDDDYESAIQDFDAARIAGMDDATLDYWRGAAFERLRDYDAAISDFSRALEKNGDYYGVLVDRGEAYLDVGDTDQAIKDLSHAIQLDPREPRPYALRGDAHKAIGEDDLALKDYDLALDSAPHDKKSLRARSSLLAELGDFVRSEADLNTLEEARKRNSSENSMAPRRTRISLLLSDHFSPLPVSDLAITERKFPFRVRADLQNAVDQLFNDSSLALQFCGVKKDHSYEGTSFSDLLFPTSHSPALAVPPEYQEVDIGEAEPARCLKNGLWFLAQDDLKYAVFLSPAGRHGEQTGVRFQIAVPQGEEGARVTEEFFKRLELAVAKSASYRGKILSLETNEYYSGMSAGIQVHKLKTVQRDQVILPKATIDLLDRNIIQFARQRTKLKDLGLSTKKGLLFYGPPGAGKTHTIHYLAGAMEGHTTLLISAEQVGLLGEYMTLARLLQPSIVVIEDADLIARERTQMESVCEEVLLNKLLNEMDGLRPDTDVFFILTTNRPQALEAALASRPGRVDQAIEFPLPDEEGRANLVRLYSRGMNVPDEVVAASVRRTEHVSASFIKELMRRAAQFQLERDGDGVLTESDIDAALEELLFAGGSLNASLLGMQRDIDPV